MKIKVKEIVEGCMPEIIKVGDWIDLYTAEDYVLKCPHAKMLHKHKNKGSKEGEEDAIIERSGDVIFNYTLLNLGIAMQLPKGFEAYLLPRSSSFKKWGILQTNSQGIIDESFKGNEDIWRMPILATRNIIIPKGTPIAQFRIQLSQKATIWQKIKWLFSSKIELVKVDNLEGEARGGFGMGSDKYRTK